MSTEVCKITFDDGTWIKAELPTGDERIEYVLDHFGMFASIEALPATDAAVVVANAKAPKLIATSNGQEAWAVWDAEIGVFEICAKENGEGYFGCADTLGKARKFAAEWFTDYSIPELFAIQQASGN